MPESASRGDVPGPGRGCTCLVLGGYLVPGGCTCLVPGGVPGPRGVYLPGLGCVPGLGGVYLTGPRGVPAWSGGCTWSWGYLPGRGVPAWFGGCTWSREGVPGQVLPPVDRMTHAYENITLPQTSFAGGNNISVN